jgi:hypothetical protein
VTQDFPSPFAEDALSYRFSLMRISTFYFWKGRLRKIGLIDPAPPPASIEPARITPAGAPRKAGKACIQLSNGVSIECPGDVDATALAALLSAMRLK